MKKRIKTIILLLIVLVIVIVFCKRGDTSKGYDVELLSSAEKVQEGQEVEITIKLKDIKDIGGDYGGIAGISTKLEYDTSKLEKVGEGEGLNNFILIEGDTIELATYPGVTEDTEVAKFKFKGIAEGEATIKLTEIEAANGEEIFVLGKDVKTTISITEK